MTIRLPGYPYFRKPPYWTLKKNCSQLLPAGSLQGQWKDCRSICGCCCTSSRGRAFPHTSGEATPGDAKTSETVWNVLKVKQSLEHVLTPLDVHWKYWKYAKRQKGFKMLPTGCQARKWWKNWIVGREWISRTTSYHCSLPIDDDKCKRGRQRQPANTRRSFAYLRMSCQLSERDFQNFVLEPCQLYEFIGVALALGGFEACTTRWKLGCRLFSRMRSEGF